MIEGFLLGIIVCGSLVAGLFFLKFWRQTRDALFLGFGVAFIVEGLNRASSLFLADPSRGNVLIYVVRLFSYLIILAVILNKNRPRRT